MKKFILLFLAALIVLALAPLPVTAQMQHKPLARELLMYYYVPLIRTEAPIKDKAYAVSQKDTSASVYIGGAGAISFEVTVADTASIDYYVDYKIDGTGTAWTNALTDSMINTGAASNAGYSQEYFFRNNTLEKYGGLNYYIRTRCAFRASGVGVSSATYTQKIFYKQ